MNDVPCPGVLAQDAFAPARQWFHAQGYTPFAFQEAVWREYAEGR